MGQDSSLPEINYKECLLLLAFKTERNLRQGSQAIAYKSGKELHMGRDILPLTKLLIEHGYLERTNPEAPKVSGYKHKTTSKGLEAIKNYFYRLNSISDPEPGFGF